MLCAFPVHVPHNSAGGRRTHLALLPELPHLDREGSLHSLGAGETHGILEFLAVPVFVRMTVDDHASERGQDGLRETRDNLVG